MNNQICNQGVMPLEPATQLDAPADRSRLGHTPGTVVLVDGRRVPSDSEEWRAECEARYVLSRNHGARGALLHAIGLQRGDAAVQAIRACMHAVEPAFVLDLPNKPQRLAYLATTADVFGDAVAAHLRDRVLALHARRKTSAADPASSA